MSAGIYSLGERRLVTAGDDFYIAAGAQIIGAVILGAAASVWFNTVLRADDERIEIGAGSNVQDGCVVHCDHGAPTILGRNVTIGHMVMLHGCVIGDESLIGNGAIVLDRVRIGRHCVIGAGALLTPDKEFPDNSVVMGSPAKVVRQVGERELAMIAQGAAHYQSRQKLYRETLKPAEFDRLFAPR